MGDGGSVVLVSMREECLWGTLELLVGNGGVRGETIDPGLGRRGNGWGPRAIEKGMSKGAKAKEGVNSEGKQDDTSILEGSEIGRWGNSMFDSELAPNGLVVGLRKGFGLVGRPGTRHIGRAGNCDIKSKEGSLWVREWMQSRGLEDHANISRALTRESLGVQKGNSLTGYPIFRRSEASKRCKVREDVVQGVTNAITETFFAVVSASKEVVAIGVKELAIAMMARLVGKSSGENG